ncbi:DUF2927 domain-containing protein [Shewanella sp. SR44-3]|uniref:DUF2927 domain-containing protein n=1 Tax=Shewanella sp. SR44-3 TaxID=2760936 RepID=UPI0015FAE925|nr:DUF2927 domain-containing protein [Shewanella sp. SR44-3]MBB1270516.1 DUF2927 domain-containing protein [Shewanella sp. SR44-3]
MRVTIDRLPALLLAGSCFGLCVGLLTSSTQASPWLEPDFIEQAFVEVALKNEYQSGQFQLRKWLNPIKVGLEHHVGNAALHTQLVSMHLEHLKQLSGHDIGLASNQQEANVRLLFTRQNLWQQQAQQLMGKAAAAHLHGAVCIAHIETKDNQITRAYIIIPVDQAQMHGKLVACIAEELTQILGLPNDSEKVFPSIFNDKTPQTLLSGLDAILIKALYSPTLKIGMNATEVKVPLQALLRAWQADGSLANADVWVRQGKLYPLLGY